MSFEVQWGWCCSQRISFASFDMALSFYRALSRKEPSARLVNVDNIDGAEGASLAAQHGLTREQWEALQDADAA